MLRLLTGFIRDDEGQDLVEYALIIVLVALAVAASGPTVTDAIIGVFADASTALGGGAAPAP